MKRFFSSILFVGILLTFEWSFASAIKCEDQRDCPSWVGAVVSINSICTGFLVASDILATNLHCLPEEIRKEGASCLNVMQVMFPETFSFKASTVKCEQVLKVSSPPQDPTHLRQDFAFLKLSEKVDRYLPSLSQVGILDNHVYTLYKMDPEKDSGGATVRKLNCVARQNSVLNPYFVEDRSPLVLFSPCAVMKGNSGSPIVGAGNQIHGILSSLTSLPVDVPLSAKVKNKKELVMAQGTNLSCIEFDKIGLGNKHSKCEVKIDLETRVRLSKEMVQRQVDRALKELKLRIEEDITKFNLVKDPKFVWQIKTQTEFSSDEDSGLILHIYYQPKCYIPKSFVKQIVSEKEKNLSFQLKKYFVYEKFDDSLRYDSFIL